MQMRGQKYIRFDSTQDLHTRVASAERLLYRIIARARTFDHSLTRAFASIAGPRRSAGAFAGYACARRPMRVCANSCFAHIFWASPRIGIGCGRAILGANGTGLTRVTQRKKVRRASTAIVSNRNGVRAHRNRIFLGRRHHIFVVETLQTLASSLETRCKSSDSRGAIRFASDAKPLL